ncbi:MAG: LON peptidase substrate-binding domain-containing protein [Gammaproteobacteria bacterium]|nr:LON peptidase substrate-binding domain-containing protein [Gammaproteobacteria bacterium]
MLTIPLFPLYAVLFPEGVLPLRIFELRYLDMVSECMRTGSGFGVCLISAGSEVGDPAECHGVGTLARIFDWEKGEDGLLRITAQGDRRFRVLQKRVRQNQLLEGDVEVIDDDKDKELPVEFQVLSDMLRQIAAKFELPYRTEHEKFMKAGWVSCRLAELLPIELADKQILLEMDDPMRRLEQIQTVLQTISPDQFAM